MIFFILKKIKIFLLAGIIAIFFFKLLGIFFGGDNFENFGEKTKKIMLNDDGFFFSTFSKSETVEEFLKDKKIEISDRDKIIPEKSSQLYYGSTILIERAKQVRIKVDGKELSGFFLGKTVEDALQENKIELSRLDKVEPMPKKLLEKNVSIVVTRINIEEKKEQEEIDFKVVAKNDSDLSWREKKIKKEGEKGINEVTYKITYKDGKEVSRTILRKEKIKDPIEQIELHGTYVKTGKAQKGQGTWYAFKGGLFAASLSIPIGHYARVTNLANGKSVIVQINDRGPYGKGRIIDLDKVAFVKIASLGAGVIGVKVEEVLN